jgi:hypothetical protein
MVAGSKEYRSASGPDDGGDKETFRHRGVRVFCVIQAESPSARQLAHAPNNQDYWDSSTIIATRIPIRKAPVHVEQPPRRGEAVPVSGCRPSAIVVKGELPPNPGGQVEGVEVVEQAWRKKFSKDEFCSAMQYRSGCLAGLQIIEG